MVFARVLFFVFHILFHRCNKIAREIFCLKPADHFIFMFSLPSICVSRACHYIYWKSFNDHWKTCVKDARNARGSSPSKRLLGPNSNVLFDLFPAPGINISQHTQRSAATLLLPIDFCVCE